MKKKKITIYIPSKEVLGILAGIYLIVSLIAFLMGAIMGAMSGDGSKFHREDNCKLDRPVAYIMAPSYLSGCYLFKPFKNEEDK